MPQVLFPDMQLGSIDHAHQLFFGHAHQLFMNQCMIMFMRQQSQ